MKRMFVTALTLTLAFLFATSAAWAGGRQAGTAGAGSSAAYQRDPNLNAPGTFPINKQKVALKVGIEQNPYVENWKTNWMTRRIEELGNYDLSFEVYPSGEMRQKLELMVMAGGADLPDIMLEGGLDLASITKYGQAGMLIPTNTYYANSAYYIKESAKDLPVDPLKYVTSYDGNIYGLYGTTVSIYNQFSPARILIYEPWLQKLGLKLPETVDEFVEVLRAFRDRDPNGNGLKDEIPLAGGRDNMNTNYLYALMSPFVFTQSNYWLLENGKVDVAYNKPGWREGLRFSKKLIDEGLLSSLSFTQDVNQLFAQISPDPPKVGAFLGTSASRLGANDPKRGQYVCLPPLQGPAGRQAFWNPPIPTIQMVITKNCKTPESAFMLGDLLGSEEWSITTRYGEKGVDWVEPPAGAKSLFEHLGYKATLQETGTLRWGTLQNKYWAEAGPQIRGNKHAGMDVDRNDPFDFIGPIARNLGPWIQYANRTPVLGLVYNDAEQMVMNDRFSTILSYVQESFARFAMGDLSIDRDWDSYVAEFSKMGLTDVIKVTQSAWDRMNK
ncbi:ABC transporter substrate-binding protein [Spirochaetia bacterium]|nr:ABC transporter substrate-binding protein [Spirochaetia bacterium]